MSGVTGKTLAGNKCPESSVSICHRKANSWLSEMRSRQINAVNSSSIQWLTRISDTRTNQPTNERNEWMNKDWRLKPVATHTHTHARTHTQDGRSTRNGGTSSIGQIGRSDDSSFKLYGHPMHSTQTTASFIKRNLSKYMHRADPQSQQDASCCRCCCRQTQVGDETVSPNSATWTTAFLQL